MGGDFFRPQRAVVNGDLVDAALERGEAAAAGSLGS
jgi:hypothetical protein